MRDSPTDPIRLLCLYLVVSTIIKIKSYPISLYLVVFQLIYMKFLIIFRWPWLRDRDLRKLRIDYQSPRLVIAKIFTFDVYILNKLFVILLSCHNINNYRPS